MVFQCLKIEFSCVKPFLGLNKGLERRMDNKSLKQDL